MLTGLSLLQQLLPFFHNNNSVVNIHTRSQGRINKTATRYINQPSLVTSDHIDIFYQIREIIHNLNVKISFIFTQAAPKEIQETITRKLSCNNGSGSVFNSIPPDPNKMDIDSKNDDWVPEDDTLSDNQDNNDDDIKPKARESTVDEKLM